MKNGGRLAKAVFEGTKSVNGLHTCALHYKR